MRKRTGGKGNKQYAGDNGHKQMLLFKREILYFSSGILVQSTIAIRQYPPNLVMVYGAQIALEFKTIKSNNTGEVDRLNTCSGNLPCEIKSTSLSGIFPSETIELPRLESSTLDLSCVIPYIKWRLFVAFPYQTTPSSHKKN